MMSTCSSPVNMNNAVQLGSLTPCSDFSGSSLARPPALSAGLTSFKGLLPVTGRFTVGASLSYSTSVAFSLPPCSSKRSLTTGGEISSIAVATQVQMNDEIAECSVPSTDSKHPWILEISIPQEVLAGFKVDYEAEAKTWPSDLGTTTDFRIFEEFVISAHMLARKWLPRDVVRRLEKFSRDPTQPSALIIRGLPIDEDLPPTTPKGAKLKIGKYMSEVWLAGISRIVGQPYNYNRFQPNHDSGMGLIIRDILPHPSDNERVGVFGSSAFLDIHCDYFQCAPQCWSHFLVFVGIKGDPLKVGRTLLADYRSVYSRTSSSDIKVLREQPLTWRLGPDPDNWFTQNVVVGSEDNPQLYLFDETVVVPNFDSLVQGNPEAIAAYKRMKRLACDLSLEHGGVRLEGGDALILNQRRIAHGRNSFEAKYDGKDRWLQKLYVNEGQIWQPYGLVPWPERILPSTISKQVTANNT